MRNATTGSVSGTQVWACNPWQSLKITIIMGQNMQCRAIKRYCAGILEHSMGARNGVGIGLSYRPAWLHRLAESIHWNRFLGPLLLWSTGVYFFVNLNYCKNEKRFFLRPDPCSTLSYSAANEERSLVIIIGEGVIREILGYLWTH